MLFRLRTLMIVLAIGPPVLAGAWFANPDYREWQKRIEAEREAELVFGQLLYGNSTLPAWQGKLLDDLPKDSDNSQ